MSIHISPTQIVRLYRVWTSMMYRCHRPDNKQYRNYGARGIFVSKEWHDFDIFCRDMGQRPNDTCHLDRIDNNQGYFKDNCRWSTPKENHRNKRNNHYYETHLGKMCQSELIEKIGYTRKQFQRCIEKYGIDTFLKMFKNNHLPKKRIISDLLDIIGNKFGKLTVLSLDGDRKTGARYFCVCDCGNHNRVTRFKLKNGIANHCKSCGKKGDLNPKRKNM